MSINWSGLNSLDWTYSLLRTRMTHINSSGQMVEWKLLNCDWHVLLKRALDSTPRRWAYTRLIPGDKTWCQVLAIRYMYGDYTIPSHPSWSLVSIHLQYEICTSCLSWIMTRTCLELFKYHITHIQMEVHSLCDEQTIIWFCVALLRQDNCFHTYPKTHLCLKDHLCSDFHKKWHFVCPVTIIKLLYSIFHSTQVT